MPPPPKEPLTKLFMPVTFDGVSDGDLSEKELQQKRVREEWEAKLRTISGRQTWTSYNPASQQELVVEAALMRHLYDIGNWDMQHSWTIAVVPEGCIIFDKLDNIWYYTMKRYKAAVVVWPLRVGAGRSYMFEKGIDRLVWLFGAAFERYQAFSVSRRSPDSACLGGGRPEVLLQSQDDGMAPLLWQAWHAFPSIGEAHLLKLHSFLDLALPTKDYESGTYKQHLSMSLMAHFFPNWAQNDAEQALRRCSAIENPTASCVLQLDAEMLKDVIISKEHTEISKYVTHLKEAVQTKHAGKESSKNVVATHFKKSARQQKRARPRWTPRGVAKAEDAYGFLVREKPAYGSIIMDLSNGRWRISFPKCGRKSVSWTVRGHEAAARQVLRQLWSWHIDSGGKPPAWNLDELADPSENVASSSSGASAT